jgi:hypothetical protein
MIPNESGNAGVRMYEMKTEAKRNLLDFALSYVTKKNSSDTASPGLFQGRNTTLVGTSGRLA